MKYSAPRSLAQIAVPVIVLFACLALTPQASATSLYKPEPVAVLMGEQASPWQTIERHKDPHPRFPEEPFHPNLTHFYPQTAEGFGTKEPHSRFFLLHTFPGFESAKNRVPVLLIPGSNDDATRRYGHPLSRSHPDHKKVTGLARFLADRGFAVFAISFSHYHGCNLHQGEHLANAIDRIRVLLGRQGDRDLKVDLVTYSKGAMAARCYVESARDFSGHKYLTAFRGDVRRIVFQVGPIGGLDMPFRYYGYNLSCRLQDKIPAPLGVSSQVIYGLWTDSGICDINSGYWPGQQQMIHDQRELGVPYGPLSWTADANLSMIAIRDGGQSLFVKSVGLEATRHLGGDMIQRLNERGLPATVSACLVAGTHPVLYDEHVHSFKMPIGAELSGESDGLVFVKSSTYTKGLTARGARITGVRTFPLNHIDISRSQEVFQYVADQLALP